MEQNYKTQEDLVDKAMNFIINEFKTIASPDDFPNEEQIKIFCSTLKTLIIDQHKKTGNAWEKLTLNIGNHDPFTEEAINKAGIKNSCLPEDVEVVISFKEGRVWVEGYSEYIRKFPSVDELVVKED